MAFSISTIETSAKREKKKSDVSRPHKKKRTPYAIAISWWKRRERRKGKNQSTTLQPLFAHGGRKKKEKKKKEISMRILQRAAALALHGGIGKK